MRITGACLCKKVRFEVSAKPTFVVHCHCSICRRAHGAAYGTFAVASKEHFKYTAGEENLRAYESMPGNTRYFCGNCGSQLTIIEAWNPTGITLVMAALDDVDDLRPSCHIFAGSKAPWHEITDGLPQHHAWPPGVGPQPAGK